MTDIRRDAQARPPTFDLDGLPDLLGFHVRMAQAALYRDFSESLADLDVTQRQCAVLKIVRANPGVSQVDIAALLGTDRATMMAMVDRLQDRALVERRPSRLDRRRQELHVTPAGEALVAKADAAIAEHEARFTSRFTKSELSGLIKALARIHGAT